MFESSPIDYLNESDAARRIRANRMVDILLDPENDDLSAADVALLVAIESLPEK